MKQRILESMPETSAVKSFNQTKARRARKEARIKDMLNGKIEDIFSIKDALGLPIGKKQACS